MDRDKPIKISLTSTNSHTVKIPAGQGSFSIGIVGMDKKKFDVLVEENLPINWNVFNDFYTPHGKQSDLPSFPRTVLCEPCPHHSQSQISLKI